ncbi:hypothetical protein [Undibacterium sp.]|jgi:hypothetical protein|uniref:hypothetical protein n=1 Tax=Undibacterium sp. TaxID=1914977 RepID=UPI002BEACBB8|nr:hypothetical protein [Undibacterium sp.]HTD06625.1 hypothetical protein [Undibacterium sp.]
MRSSYFVVSSLLLCATLAAPACAQTQAHAEPSSSPTREDLARWKMEVLDKYNHVSFFDIDGKPIAEAAFMQVLMEKRSGFKMKSIGAEQNRTISVELRLMSEQETRETRSSQP